MPESIEKTKAFFEVYQLHPDLATAKRLIFKAELEAAAREAFIAVENKLRIIRIRSSWYGFGNKSSFFLL